MRMQCRMVPADKTPKEPGDMWFSEIVKDDASGRYFCEEGGLSDEYVRDYLGKRPPLIVAIPARVEDEIRAYPFGIDTHVTGETRGWTVTGEPPNITVSPSIHLPGHWHGWLTAGVLHE